MICTDIFNTSRFYRRRFCAIKSYFQHATMLQPHIVDGKKRRGYQALCAHLGRSRASSIPLWPRRAVLPRLVQSQVSAVYRQSAVVSKADCDWFDLRPNCRPSHRASDGYCYCYDALSCFDDVRSTLSRLFFCI